MKKERKKIIYVDDVNYSLITVKSRLKDYYEIYPAHSAGTLFEILGKIVPALILLDINMPGVNGYKIMEMLKENDTYAHIPVIFLTGKNDKKSIVKAMNLGAVDFVAKPFIDSELIESIENQVDPEKKSAQKPVILAVDDSPSILQSVNHALHEHYKVYTLPKPELIEVLLTKVVPDLFLLDYKMPKLTGFDLIPIIRTFPEHKETPVIFLTAVGTVDNLNVAYNLGASDFIVKPIDEVILNKKIGIHTANYIMMRRIRSLSAVDKGR